MESKNYSLNKYELNFKFIFKIIFNGFIICEKKKNFTTLKIQRKLKKTNFKSQLKATANF